MHGWSRRHFTGALETGPQREMVVTALVKLKVYRTQVKSDEV